MDFIYNFLKNGKDPETNDQNIVSTETDTSQLAKDFKGLFTNTLDYQEYTVEKTDIIKKDENKDLIYTIYQNTEVVENNYDLSIHMPYINISNSAVEKFNTVIQQTFLKKAAEILKTTNNNTIYSVEYAAYINTNILSLVIKSTLKEGNNPQRTIIQTFNYNLSTNEVLNLGSILTIKGLATQTVEQKIAEVVKEANKEAESLKNLGLNVYLRDLASDIYQVKNTTNYFIGPKGNLYIIYPYGNSNYTSDTDIIVF